MTNLERIQKVADELGTEYSVYEKYSGRMMFGATCLGIVGPEPDEIRTVASRYGINNPRTDQMGLDFIVYWPHLQ